MSSLTSSFKGNVPVVLILLLAIALGGPLWAQSPNISIEVGNVSAAPGDQQVEIPVYFNNYTDTVVAFEMWFQLDRPDICLFDIDSTTIFDTTYWQCTSGTPPTCTDSVSVTAADPWDFIHVDTIGTFTGGLSLAGGMVENWETVFTRSLSGLGTELKVVAFANASPPAGGVVGILPGENGRLFSLVFNCLMPPDFVTDRVARIIIARTTDHLSFSDPHGQSIGLTCSEVPDSTCFVCSQWTDAVCLSWTQAAFPPYDSCDVYSSNVCVLDSNKILTQDGTLTLCGPIVAGDVNGDGNYDISDLTMLTDFAIDGTPPLPNPTNADVNGDCYINWEDINLLQVGGPFTDCGCPDPVWFCCIGMRGNVDYDVTGGADDIDISDLTFLVNFMFKQGDSPMCPDEANVDGDSSKSIDIADLTRLANYMFKSGAPPANCSQ